MSTVVMNNPVFECTELFKNATAAKPQDTNQQSRLQHYSDDQQQQAISSCSSNLRRSYTSLVNLIEQHRKLDRSVSEPTSRYKTELCRPFEENGSCKYGDKCQFAHGYNELRNLARHPKYKTELCRTFHKIGFCPYGPRCHFVHNFEEARIHNLKVSAQLSQSTPLQLQSQSLYPSEFTHHHQQSSLQHQTISSSNTNTQVAGLTPLLQPLSVNMSLLEHLASSPQVVAAVAAASASASSNNLIRANSLNLAAAAAAAAAATATAAASGSSSSDYPQRLTLQRSNSLCVPQQHQHQNHYQHQLLHIQSRPKPLNLSPTFSLGSNADSTSPSSSLSQSPTNSMASFFSDDPGLNSCFPFNSNQEETLDSSTRTPSPLPSVHAPVFECPRLPVFNRISRTIADLEHLHI